MMRFRRFKQMLAWILALSVLVSMMFVSTAFADDGKQGLTLREKFGDKTTSGYKIDFYEDNIIYYWDVLAEYADKGYQPTEGITIEIPAAENFKSSIPVDQVPIWDELGGKKGKFLIWENDVQWMEWTFEVETPGLYNIEVDYYPLVDSKSSGRISMWTSSVISGMTSKEAKEVCLLPDASKGEMRTKRWTPFSAFKYP